MKRLLFILCLVALMSSCSSFRSSTSSTLDVSTSLVSATTADLVVSEKKISYTYYPKKMDRKAGLKHVISNAIAAALKECGDADILVECQHETVFKKRLMGKKIKSVTVTGYPATFKNFKVKNTK